MSEFDTAARALSAAQRDREAARRDLHRARERLARAEERARVATRRLDPRDARDRERRQALEAELEELRRDAVDAGRALGEAGARLDTTGETFTARFSDPRTQLPALAAATPILLLPLRVETRFKDAPEGQGRQLWVRVFPDDCMVDTFEDTPSEAELRGVRRFWRAWARAGGIEADQRAAWRALVAGSGAGRAAWLLQQHAPAELADLPVKAEPSEVFLVVAGDAPVPEAERPPVAEHWRAVWVADDDRAALDAARSALDAALGPARAAEVVEAHRPVNLDEAPPAGVPRDAVRVEVVFLSFPLVEDVAAQRQAWSRPARVHVLPERLVLLGYRDGDRVLEVLGESVPSPLAVGPDPLAAEDEQLRGDGGELTGADELAWLLDFDAAVAAGMAFRVDLSPGDEAGFDELLVCGVRLAADPGEGAALVETLLEHHHRGTAGLEVLATGTPTNNTGERGSGFSEREDADASFDLAFGRAPALVRQPDPLDRPDGQWLADTLGIGLPTLEDVPGARGRDQSTARALNTALWPATIGYFMDSMMAPAFDGAVVDATRWFFTTFVTGRGLAPAVRVGDQPYGILPATAHSRTTWLDEVGPELPPDLAGPEGADAYLRGLRAVLDRVRADWATLAEEAPHVGQDGDPHQVLLDVVGLTPSSVEFHTRYAESLEALANRMNLAGVGGALVGGLIAAGVTRAGMDLLARLGWDGEEAPEILEKLFHGAAQPLDGGLVDDRPLSATEPLRAVTVDGRNYLGWLADAAATSLERLRRQEEFVDEEPPTALLYLLLRHGLQQGWFDTGLRLLAGAGVLDAAELASARIDASFVHVSEQPGVEGAAGPAAGGEHRAAGDGLPLSGKPVAFERASESRYHHLYAAAPAVTGDDRPLAEAIPGLLGGGGPTRFLREQVRALELLESVPTAALERALAEHVDLCTYRLDAWRWGLVHHQLALLREGIARPPLAGRSDLAARGHEPGAAPAGEPGAGEEAEPGQGSIRRGIHLGAFGYLQDVRPAAQPPEPADLPQELAGEFAGEGLPPLLSDPAGAGYVHAPSLDHAVTAAVLRGGHRAHAERGSGDAFAVDLSSGRVRAALEILEGMRNEQPLGALLGYRLERALHERHAEAELDAFIFPLRRAFPLAADHIADTEADPGEPIEAIAASNVVDGLALVEHVRETGAETYPFGRSLPDADDTEARIITEEVARLLDLHDAIADLALAESVHQTVLGNHERASAVLETFSQGAFPPESEVVRTPRSGLTLNHRVALHLEAGLDAGSSPNGVPVTARTLAEPAVNRWLDGVLPDPGVTGCTVVAVDPTDGTEREHVVTQAELGLQPLDLLFATAGGEGAMTGLDERVVGAVFAREGLRPDTEVRVDYRRGPAGGLSWFAVASTVRSARGLVLRSRPLEAGDLGLFDDEATAAAEVSVDPARVQSPLDRLSVLLAGGAADDLPGLLADGDALLGDPAANRAAIAGAVEGWLERYAVLARRADEYGIPQASTAGLAGRRAAAYRSVLARLDEHLDGWRARLDDVAAALAAVPGLPSEDERFEALRVAERLVSPAYTSPQPPTSTDYAAALEAQRLALVAKRDALAAVRQAPPASVAGLLAAVEAELPTDAFDTDPLEVDSVRDELVRLAEDLREHAGTLAAEVTRRRDAAATLLAEAVAATAPRERVDRLRAAARALFGDDFPLVEEFSLADDHATELARAWADRGELLRYLSDPAPAGLASDLPVDTWLYGAARVREKLAHLEHLTMTTEAFGTTVPELVPLQLPYHAGDRWLALRFPEEDVDLDGDRLAYTAHFTTPFDPRARQCGLLLDHWSEVIPSREETTGLAFHFDRPNSQPPQAWLVVTPASLRTGWTFDDLVDAVRETFDEARLRAVEPSHVDGTDYALFLPAAIMAATRQPITIGLHLARNIQAGFASARSGDG